MAKPVRATRTIEDALRRSGYVRVAGCDEVGRGCLAGPVVAAAVVLGSDAAISGLADSKLLSPPARERLYEEITELAAGWAIGSVPAAKIDTLGIQHASLEAMRLAVLGVVPEPDFVLVDAFTIPDLPMAQRGIVGGDRQCAAIAAASIVAKVTRDREMVQHDATDPRFGYAQHKGYPTLVHLAAIDMFGITFLHRRSFGPVARASRTP